jgi:hypothetical protein
MITVTPFPGLRPGLPIIQALRAETDMIQNAMCLNTPLFTLDLSPWLPIIQALRAD